MLLFLLSLAAFSAEVEHGNVEWIDEGLRGRVEHIFSDNDLQHLQNDSETHEYQAEVTRLMNILVDSLYENKEVFLRELISNANDALDKIRFSSLRDPSVLEKGPRDLEILIDVDEDNKTLSITDTGIGMTKKDLVEKLGTIARSGTNDFQKLLQSSDTSLIGQFGVGFYSAFLVANKVTVISKSNADDRQWIWIGDSGAHFSVVEDPRGCTLGRGTQIILHLKENAYQYLDRDRLVGIMRHYSMFVDFPVKIWHHHQVFEDPEEVGEDLEEGEEGGEDDIFDGTDVIEGSDEESSEFVTFQSGQEQKKGVKKKVWQWEQVNKGKPLWLQDPANIPESDYSDFYKAYCKENNAPLFHAHFKAEGRITFNALLFVPAKSPGADQVMERITRNVRLYVKRVLVQDEWSDELLPDYLHFVKGVIDSADLTLNVDRDHLSEAKALRLIKRRVTSKLLATFQHLYQFEPGVYFNFYKNFAGNLKYGVIEDSANRKALSKLLMFYTSYSPNDLVTLDDYVLRMKKGQEKIYYIGSSTRESAAVSPYLEDLYSRGIEVIFAVEPIDLYCLERIDDFDGIPLENPEKDKDRSSRPGTKELNMVNMSQSEFNTINRWFKKVVGERIEKIALSTRLKSTPAICTCTNWGYTASQERLIRAQTVHDQRLTDSIAFNRKVLELNPEHPVIIEMFKRIKDTPNNEELKEDARLLFDTAMVAGGFAVDGILNYTKRLFRMMSKTQQLEEQVHEFESENQVYYTTIDDEFKVDKNRFTTDAPKKAKKPGTKKTETQSSKPSKFEDL